jgi:hypothetical protein
MAGDQRQICRRCSVEPLPKRPHAAGMGGEHVARDLENLIEPCRSYAIDIFKRDIAY